MPTPQPLRVDLMPRSSANSDPIDPTEMTPQSPQADLISRSPVTTDRSADISTPQTPHDGAPRSSVSPDPILPHRYRHRRPRHRESILCHLTWPFHGDDATITPCRSYLAIINHPDRSLAISTPRPHTTMPHDYPLVPTQSFHRDVDVTATTSRPYVTIVSQP